MWVLRYYMFCAMKAWKRKLKNQRKTMNQ